MAREVVAKVIGAEPKAVPAHITTVRGVKEFMNAPSYTASINGEPASDSASLQDNDYVTLSPAVKGA